MSIYKQRREQVMAKMQGGMALVFAAPERKRNSDVLHPYRQDSSFFYLTGFNEPEAVLVLTPEDKDCKSRIFLRTKDPLKEQWDGKRLGVDAAVAELGVDQAFAYGEFSRQLVGLLENKTRVYLDMYEEPENVQKVLSLAQKAGMKKRSSFGPSEFFHLLDIIGPLRQIKDEFDVKTLKEACRINTIAHHRAFAMAKPGLNEADIHADIVNTYKRHQTREAYGSIVATGDNANILHYIENNAELKDGDLLLIDAGPEFHCNASDVTRTFPVNGKYEGAAKDLYNAVLDVQKKCIEQVKPGNSSMGNHDYSEKLLAQALLDLKIIEGNLDQVMEQKLHRKYYPHGLGHWLGLDVHDVGAYLEKDGTPLKFVPGMCLTIEPGLYIPSDDLGVPESFRGIGIRIEDDILVTADGNENLTAAIAKEISDIELACQANIEDIK